MSGLLVLMCQQSLCKYCEIRRQYEFFPGSDFKSRNHLPRFRQITQTLVNCDLLCCGRWIAGTDGQSAVDQFQSRREIARGNVRVGIFREQFHVEGSCAVACLKCAKASSQRPNRRSM